MSAARQVVWKYPLRLVVGAQEVTTPADARAVHFGMQGDIPTMWMLVEEGPSETVRQFVIVGTGDLVVGYREAAWEGTTQHGPFVWHLFQLLSEGAR